MAKNTTAIKRGFSYDKTNSRMSVYVDGVEGIRLTKSATGVDIRFLGDTPASHYMDYDASTDTWTITGDVAVTGDITIGSEDISVAQGRYIYLDGQGGGEYIRSDTADDLMLNATTNLNLAIGGTDVMRVTSSGVSVPSAVVQAFKAEYNITSQLGAWVHGVKVELTRAADIQPATGGWYGGQFVLNAGSSGYTALNKDAYALQAVFKGSDTNPDGTDIHVARFETQSAGKVSDICYITANTGTTIVGSLLYLATHIAPGNSMALLNVQSSQTVGKGLAFLAGSGSTLTSLLYCSGAGTFTNFLEVAATGNGGVTVGTTDIAGDLTADAYLTIKVGSNSYKVLGWAA